MIRKKIMQRFSIIVLTFLLVVSSTFITLKASDGFLMNNDRPMDSGKVRVAILLESGSVTEQGFEVDELRRKGQQAISCRKAIVSEQQAMAERISREVLNGEDLDVIWNLSLLTNIISAYVETDQITAISRIPGVRAVYREQFYGVPEDQTDEETGKNQMSFSGKMIGSYEAYENGYTGAGMRIAVIDTGLAYDHQSFDGSALEYSLQRNAMERNQDYDSYLSSLDLLDTDELSELLTQLNSYNYVNYYHGDNGSREAMGSQPTAESLYFSSKVAYGFNYISVSSDITHLNDYCGEHGSHVAGIAAANRYIPDASSPSGYYDAMQRVCVRGVAPDAQLLVMKVLGTEKKNSSSYNYRSGAWTSDYMAAIEDALILKADVINMSLGSEYAGFSEEIDNVFQSVLDRVEASGTILSISNGNAYSWAHYTESGLPYRDDVNYATNGNPSSYRSAMAVASVQSPGFSANYIETGCFIDINRDGLMNQDDAHDILYYVNYGCGPQPGRPYDWTSADVDGDGTVTSYDAHQLLNIKGGARIFYREYTDENANVELSSLAGEQTYIYIDGTGTYSELYRLKSVIGGRIVICQAASPFDQTTANYAIMFGAKAIIFCGIWEDLNLSAYGYTAPLACVRDGSALKDNAEEKVLGGAVYYQGTLTVGQHASVIVDNEDVACQFNDFSSWGIPGSLEIKPDITAPGGNILSVNGSHTVYIGEQQTFDWQSFSSNKVVGNQHSYETRSGTSMAAPQISGMAALVMQHIDEDELDGSLSSRQLAQSLLMSTAVPITDPSTGLPYSILRQGAGLANVWKALKAHSYLTIPASYSHSAADGKVKIEFGDDPSRTGSYSYKFNINNISDKPLTYHLSSELYTQAISGDFLSNDLAPLSFTASYSSADTVTIAANESLTVTVSLKLTSAQKSNLNADYPKGAYIEGYMHVRADDSQNDADHSIVMLGYYGNWSDPSMFDHGSYLSSDHEKSYTYDSLTAKVYGKVFNVNQGDLVKYYNNITFNNEKNPVTSQTVINTGGRIDRFYYRLIRNASVVVGIITDKNDNILYMTDKKINQSALYSYGGKIWISDNADMSGDYMQDYLSDYINFNKTVSTLSGIGNNSIIKVSVVAIPEYYTRGMSSAQITSAWLKNLIRSGNLGEGTIKTVTLKVGPNGNGNDVPLQPQHGFESNDAFAMAGNEADVDTEQNTVTLRYVINGDTNGKQTIRYDSELLHFQSLNGNEALHGPATRSSLSLQDQTVYYTYRVDEEAGMIAFDFASAGDTSGTVIDLKLGYEENGGILTSGIGRTVIDTTVLESNSSLTPFEMEETEVILGYVVSGQVEGEHGSCEGPFAVEREGMFTLNARSHNGYKITGATVNGQPAETVVSGRNASVTFTVDEPTEVIFLVSETEMDDLCDITSLVNGGTGKGIMISYREIATAEKYQLEVSEDGTNWQVLSDSIAENSFLDSTATWMGKTYYYRARAYIDGQWGEYGDSASLLRNPFIDVYEGTVDFTHVAWAYNHGIVGGAHTSEGDVFKLDGLCTRAQFCIMLYKMNGMPTDIDLNNNPFRDIGDQTSNTRKAIIWCYEQGIVKGSKNDNTIFAPKGNIKRSQLAIMLYKMAGEPETDISDLHFSDIGSQTIGTKKAIVWCYQNNMISSITGDKFQPNLQGTRALLTEMLYEYDQIYHVVAGQ